MAWRMNQCSRGKPGSMTGFLTKTKRYPASSPDVLEVVLRRDRQVVTSVLVFVIVAYWLYLLAGAGTSMYPRRVQKSVRGVLPPAVG